MAALFRAVPNTLVKWSHAWLGGALVALAFEAAKKLLTLYLSAMPTYSVVYGAFATVPILLIWVYLAWLIVLCGAVIVASLPGWLAGELRSSTAPAWNFQLALETLAALEPGPDTAGTLAGGPLATTGEPATQIGMTLAQLCSQLHVDPLQLGPVLHGLLQLDWIGQLDEMQPRQDPRFVLLVNLDIALQAPLVAQFLWTPSTRAHPVWEQGIVPTAAVRHLL
jgi:membrane protein